MTSLDTNPRSLDLSRALVAGLVATIIMTVVMAFFGMNLMKMLGGMFLPGSSTGVQYAVGGAMHLMVGLIYAVIFAWLFGRVRVWHPVVKGTIYGLAIGAIALAVMPVAAAVMGGGAAANPCNPCAAKGAANPCNPCAAKAANPCNPCAAKAANPCNPCGGSGQGPWAGMISIFNHLVYGLVLALIYGRRGTV